MTAPRTRPYWTIEHPEVGARLVVAAGSEAEARMLAWHRWYAREPKSELDELLRAAFAVRDSGEAAE